jgi:rhamnose transport system permease protein
LELAVITATVLGGISIFGGTGTMIGAMLSLLLIGLVRTGMSLKTIQGQVQDIVIGLLLILSVMLPWIGRAFSNWRGWSQHFSVAGAVRVMLVIVGIALFVVFFLWSRSVTGVSEIAVYSFI